MPTGPNRLSTIQRVVIRIDEVDIPNRAVHGYDKTNVLIVATFRETANGILYVPAQKERWIAERQGQGQWRLVTRLDSADQQAYVESTLGPGDMRIAAENIYFTGTVHGAGGGGSAGGDLTGTYPNPTIKSSVALAGNPTTTTQLLTDNSTRIATTAYVRGQGYVTATTAPVTSVFGRTGAVVAVSGDYSLTQIGAGTNHRLAISGSSTMSSLAAGSAGQLLQSAGSSADPAWTTATYPGTAGTAGNVLTSDGTNFISQALVISWTQANETWTFVSADGPTGVFSVAADVTSKYSPGMRLTLAQSGTTKYFIVTAVSTYSGGVTNITCYGGTDYTLANAAIVGNAYATVKAPQGFNCDPAKWTETTTNSSDVSVATPTQNAWVNPGSLSLSIPIGAWRVQYQVVIDNTLTITNAPVRPEVSLSTSNSSESDNRFSVTTWAGAASGTTGRVIQSMTRERFLNLAAKTSYFLICRSTVASNSAIDFRGDLQQTVITATCAYL